CAGRARCALWLCCSLRTSAGDDAHVFVAAAGEADEDSFAGVFSRPARGGGDGVAGFERGDDAFGATELVEGGEGFFVGGAHVLLALNGVEDGVFGADVGVVEAGGDGVGVGDLAVRVL